MKKLPSISDTNYTHFLNNWRLLFDILKKVNLGRSGESGVLKRYSSLFSVKTCLKSSQWYWLVYYLFVLFGELHGRLQEEK